MLVAALPERFESAADHHGVLLGERSALGGSVGDLGLERDAGGVAVVSTQAVDELPGFLCAAIIASVIATTISSVRVGAGGAAAALMVVLLMSWAPDAQIWGRVIAELSRSRLSAGTNVLLSHAIRSAGWGCRKNAPRQCARGACFPGRIAGRGGNGMARGSVLAGAGNCGVSID